LKYLLDTNICIYALNHRPPEVLARLQEVGPAAVAISVITMLELRHGAEKSQNPAGAHHKLDLFLSPIRTLPFDERAAMKAAQLRADLDRRGLRIGDLDSLIAGHALSEGLVLVSNNLRELTRVHGLDVENWVLE